MKYEGTNFHNQDCHKVLFMYLFTNRQILAVTHVTGILIDFIQFDFFDQLKKVHISL